MLTSDRIETAAAAWAVVFASARRWQIEAAWCYGKSELALERPRVGTWERREKLLLMVTVADAFLLSLLTSALQALQVWVLRWGCHRTGRHLATAHLPLYRLRTALSRLWLASLTPMSHPERSG